MNYHDRLTDRERIRIHAQTKHEQLKGDGMDILIDAVHGKFAMAQRYRLIII